MRSHGIEKYLFRIYVELLSTSHGNLFLAQCSYCTKKIVAQSLQIITFKYISICMYGSLQIFFCIWKWKRKAFCFSYISCIFASSEHIWNTIYVRSFRSLTSMPELCLSTFNFEKQTLELREMLVSRASALFLVFTLPERDACMAVFSKT